MNTNDANLIQRILDGDEGAFTTLVNKYQKPVHALVWRKIGDFHIAEEITQDVFLKVYKRLSTLKRRDHFPGWLYVIATRHCIAWLRKKQLPMQSLDAMSTAELEKICYAQYEADHDEEAAIEHRRELVKRLTLYLLAPSELLASTDAGKTWNTLSARPEGYAVALVTTDTAIYLILKTEIFRFRSEDADQPWEPIGETLRPLALQALADNKLEEVRPPNPAAWDFYAIRNMVFRIWDALAIDNTLFIGTSWGIFRSTDTWEKLPVPTLDGIKSLAATEHRLYAGTIRAPGLAAPELGPEPQAATTVFASTNLGDSWTDITPTSRGHFIRTAEVVTVGDTLILPGYGLRSEDGGKTWITLGGDLSRISVFPAIALDENTLYAGGTGIRRSTDGGLTWHPFMTGIVNSRVPNLFVFENVLYALTPTKMLKSAEGGESWESVDLISANENASPPFLPPSLRKGFNAFTTKVTTADGVLYTAISFAVDGDTFYIGTKQNGVLRFQRDGQ